MFVRIHRWIVGLSMLGVLTLVGITGAAAALAPPSESGRAQVAVSGTRSELADRSSRPSQGIQPFSGWLKIGYPQDRPSSQRSSSSSAELLPSASESMTIKLNELNGSGDFGTATLTTGGPNQVRVVIQMGGAMPMEHNHPAHIHKGTCTALDPTPAYPLNAVTNGQSDTTVPVALTALMASSYAINLHESPAAITTYTACGDITMMNVGTAAGAGGTMGGSSSRMPPTGQGPGGPPWLPWAALAGLALLAGGLLHRQGRHTA